DVLISAPLSNRYLASNNQGQFNQLVWNVGLEFYFPFNAPAFDANVFDGGGVTISPGDPDPGIFGEPELRWQQLISDSIDSTGRRYVWILLPVPVLTLPDESDGDGWTIANGTDTDTAIAGTGITIPAGTSAYLVFTGGAWQHLPLTSAPERLAFQPLTTANSAIATDATRHIWLTEPVPTLTLTASQPGDGFLVVNDTDTETAIDGTGIVIPAGASAYLIFDGSVWDSVLLAPPAPPPERLNFQLITVANDAIATDATRHIWIDESVPSLTLPASQPGDGFLVVNSTDTDSEVPGENQGDPAIALPPQSTTLFVRTAQGWSSQAIGGSSGGSSGGPSVSTSPDGSIIYVNILDSDFASSLDPDILFSFGTNFGGASWSNPLDGVRCSVQGSSSIGSTPPTRLGDRASNYFQTQAAPGSWVAIDFDASAAGHLVNLNAFAWQHVPDFANARLQHLVVEAGVGTSLPGASWTTIATISDPNFLPNAAGSWSSVRALVEQPQPYRFVRIRSTGPDSGGGNNLVGSEVVFGGEIHRGDI
ncbi:MAG: discoidin domain-containing protein, partial [Cyanobacteria bacterium P01_H01_bin.130]